MKQKNREKLSLTGSLQSLAKEAQTKSVIKEEKKNTVYTQDWDKVVELSNNIKNGSEKIVSTYIYEHLKKDLEMIKSLEGLENVSLSAFLSAIVESFLRNNTELIKELMEKRSGRF